MQVGDMVAIGWNGETKLPFPAIIIKTHDGRGYDIYIFAACRTNFVPATYSFKKYEDYLNI